MAQGIILAKENDMFYLIQLFLCRSISAKESETASLYLFLVEWKGDHFSGGGEKRGRMTAMCMLTMYKIPQPFQPNLSFKPPTKCTEPLHWSGFDQFSSLRLTNWCTLEYPTNIYLIMTPKAQPADAWPYSMGVVHSHQRSPVLFSEKPPCNSPVLLVALSHLFFNIEQTYITAPHNRNACYVSRDMRMNYSEG